jgi:hypothetical protein
LEITSVPVYSADCIITPDLTSPEETRFVDIVSMGVRRGKGQGGALATPGPLGPSPLDFQKHKNFGNFYIFKAIIFLGNFYIFFPVLCNKKLLKLC